MINDLPANTVERLSLYRRALLNYPVKKKPFIHSHQLAHLLKINPAHVRRDLMLIEYSGTLRKGYNIKELIGVISEIIDNKEGVKAAVVGMGDLGKALIKYVKGKRHKLEIVSGFDSNPEKVGKKFSGIKCYSVDDLESEIKKQNIKLGILTVPANQAKETTAHMVNAGIKGVLNYTPMPVNVPEGIHLEEYDMITTLEKVAFYIKVNEEKKVVTEGTETPQNQKSR